MHSKMHYRRETTTLSSAFPKPFPHSLATTRWISRKRNCCKNNVLLKSQILLGFVLSTIGLSFHFIPEENGGCKIYLTSYSRIQRNNFMHYLIISGLQVSDSSQSCSSCCMRSRILKSKKSIFNFVYCFPWMQTNLKTLNLFLRLNFNEWSQVKR